MAEKSLVKPKLRGVSHFFACVAAVAAGIYLVQAAATPRAMQAALVYVLTLVFLFAVSTVYHWPNWSPKPRMWLRRIDHAAIFIFIAGSSTPIFMVLLDGATGRKILAILWTVAGLGFLQSVFWVHAPKPLTALFYVLVGLVTGAFLIPHFSVLFSGMGFQGFALLAAGAILYGIGAVIYALRKPNPLPAVFGYHEIFHALVILASLCHFLVIRGIVLGSA